MPDGKNNKRSSHPTADESKSALSKCDMCGRVDEEILLSLISRVYAAGGSRLSYSTPSCPPFSTLSRKRNYPASVTLSCRTLCIECMCATITLLLRIPPGVRERMVLNLHLTFDPFFGQLRISICRVAAWKQYLSTFHACTPEQEGEIRSVYSSLRLFSS